jgi:hypothetical protein
MTFLTDVEEVNVEGFGNVCRSSTEHEVFEVVLLNQHYGFYCESVGEDLGVSAGL